MTGDVTINPSASALVMTTEVHVHVTTLELANLTTARLAQMDEPWSAKR